MHWPVCVAENREVGDVTTLADSSVVVARLLGRGRSDFG
jgi:hypothetical protein